MLALIQSFSTYHYIFWEPSDEGPILTRHGSIATDETGNFAQTFGHVLAELNQSQSLKNEVLTLSLDSSGLVFSESEIPKGILDTEFIEWQNRLQFTKEFLENHECYSFPFSYESQFLNVFVPISVKENMRDNMEKFSCEMRSMNVGIFSAEEATRYWLSVEKKHEVYTIWKLGRYNTDQFLIVDHGKLFAFFTIRRSSAGANIVQGFGDVLIQNEFLKTFEDGTYTKYQLPTEMVYIYTNDSKDSELRKIMNLGIPNIELISAYDLVQTIDEHPPQKFASSHFAESGQAFRGLDV